MDDTFFPAAHGAKSPHAREVLFDSLSLLSMGREKNLEGMGEAAVHGAKRPHAKEVLRDAFFLLPIRGRQNLEGMGEATVHGAKRLNTKEDNIMPIVNGWIPLIGLCGSMLSL